MGSSTSSIASSNGGTRASPIPTNKWSERASVAPPCEDARHSWMSQSSTVQRSRSNGGGEVDVVVRIDLADSASGQLDQA